MAMPIACTSFFAKENNNFFSFPSLNTQYNTCTSLTYTTKKMVFQRPILSIKYYVMATLIQTRQADTPKIVKNI